MSEHVWIAVAISVLADAEARALAAMSMGDRLDDVCGIIGQHPPDSIHGGPEVVRGPLCKICRVAWADVHRNPTEPWPCPGERPRALGGSIMQQGQGAVSRQDARRQRREANKAAESKRREEQRAKRPLPRGTRRAPEPGKDLARAVSDALVRKRMTRTGA